MDKINEMKKIGWISSLEVLKRTGISRATLNNYIKMNILPKPIVKKPDEVTVRARMLGYFPETVIELIEQINLLKRKGYSMDQVIEKLGKFGQSPFQPEETVTIRAPQPEMPSTDGSTPQSQPVLADTTVSSSRDSLNVTINDIQCPAYLLNNNFEIDWINQPAEDIIFHQKIHTIKEPTKRNIFRLLMHQNFESPQRIQDFFDFHLRFLKARMSKDDLEKFYEGISPSEVEALRNRYERVDPCTRQTVDKRYFKLLNNKGITISNFTYYMVFREGTLFIHAPLDTSAQGIMDLFSCRSKVISDLLRQRMPTLVSFCVLVADLQNSVRICAELPPEEYFELINQIWACVEGSFKQYYGTYGKHIGDGMLYYFLRERDNKYIMNSISCALEIRENVRKLNMDWKIRRGWFNDLYLNIGINEGQEYFGTIPSAPSVEFTALGDSVNIAGRLSEFARYGAIWTTKNLINKLADEEKAGIRYGIRRKDLDREIFIESSFSRIIDLLAELNEKNSKFMDIATLPVTEIISRR